MSDILKTKKKYKQNQQYTSSSHGPLFINIIKIAAFEYMY